MAGKGLVRAVGVPVEMRWGDARRRCSPGARTRRSSAVRPAELALFLFGREQTRGLTFEGPAERVRALRHEDKGL